MISLAQWNIPINFIDESELSSFLDQSNQNHNSESEEIISNFKLLKNAYICLMQLSLDTCEYNHLKMLALLRNGT